MHHGAWKVLKLLFPESQSGEETLLTAAWIFQMLCKAWPTQRTRGHICTALNPIFLPPPVLHYHQYMPRAFWDTVTPTFPLQETDAVSAGVGSQRSLLFLARKKFSFINLQRQTQKTSLIWACDINSARTAVSWSWEDHVWVDGTGAHVCKGARDMRLFSCCGAPMSLSLSLFQATYAESGPIRILCCLMKLLSLTGVTAWVYVQHHRKNITTTIYLS